MMSYSIDMAKKTAFHDELVNIIDFLPNSLEIIIVKAYFQQRIKEIERAYK